jgi:puromycin-sensitive aminopeptidase
MFGDADILTEARRRFDLHVAGTTLLPADLRSPVYRAVLSQGDETTFNTMLKVFNLIL